MKKINPIDIYPFTLAQLDYFHKEIEKTGTFDKLMKQKEALEYSSGTWVIALKPDVEAYKKKHLNGIYSPLKTHYSTETPFTFWADMNTMMKKAKSLL